MVGYSSGAPCFRYLSGCKAIRRPDPVLFPPSFHTPSFRSFYHPFAIRRPTENPDKAHFLFFSPHMPIPKKFPPGNFYCNALLHLGLSLCLYWVRVTILTCLSVIIVMVISISIRPSVSCLSLKNLMPFGEPFGVNYLL